MLKRDPMTVSGKEYLRSYSDANYYINKVGTSEIYSEAIDPIELSAVRQYVETDQKIPDPEEPVEEK